MYEIDTRKHEPKNFFAGDFPTLPETGVAGAAIEECMPVAKNADGKIVPVAAPAEGKEMEVVGIAAAKRGGGESRSSGSGRTCRILHDWGIFCGSTCAS